MSFILQPWHIVLLALSAMTDGERDKAIDYLLMENQVLREKLGKGRILLNDDQRRRLAVKGKVLGRKALHEIATIVTVRPENSYSLGHNDLGLCPASTKLP